MRSENLIYGCRSGELFERRFDDWDDYSRNLNAIEQDLGHAEREQERRHVLAVLENVLR